MKCAHPKCGRDAEFLVETQRRWPGIDGWMPDDHFHRTCAEHVERVLRRLRGAKGARWVIWPAEDSETARALRELRKRLEEP